MALPLSILSAQSAGNDQARQSRIAHSPFPSEYSLHHTESIQRPESIASIDSSVPEMRETERNYPQRMLREPPSRQALHDHYSTHSKEMTPMERVETNDPDFEVDWEGDNDPENPYNWPVWYKSIVIAAISWGTFCTVVYSTSYTSATADLEKEFHTTNEPLVTLGLTTYLFGLAAGSMVLAPISEMFGRRPVYIIGMIITTLLIIPCGIGNSLAELIVVRFFGAFFGAAMIGLAPGTINDISAPKYRALSFSIWATGPLNGPTFGPIIGGFATQYLGWRWCNWIMMMATGSALVFIALIKETYTPILLRQKAARMRKEEKDDRYWCAFDEKQMSFLESMRVNLTRPFMMIVTEPICLFWDLYIGIIYGILYLCFVAYPIIFEQIRGWSNGITGLSFMGIAIGCFIVLFGEPLIRKMILAHKPDPATGKPPPEAMVSVVCISAILSPIGQMWFSWTCLPPVHWIVPILSGIPFGMGNTGIFIYATNYLATSYGLYGASAMAGNSVIRSVIGGLLPLAGPKMYKNLNPHWAGTTLGLIQIACIPIPFLFYKYGYKIRMKSALIRSLQEEAEKREEKKRNRAQRLADRAVNAAKRMSQRSSKRFSRHAHNMPSIEDEFDLAARNAKRNSRRYEKMGDEEFHFGLARSSTLGTTRTSRTSRSMKRSSKRLSNPWGWTGME